MVVKRSGSPGQSSASTADSAAVSVWRGPSPAAPPATAAPLADLAVATGDGGDGQQRRHQDGTDPPHGATGWR